MSRFDAELTRTVDERIGDLLPQQSGRMGVLVSVDATGPGCDVIFDGDVGTSPVKRWSHVQARPGDRVGLQRFEADWVVVGGFGTTATASIECMNISNGTITSTSNQLVSNRLTTIDKGFDATRMRITIHAGGWALTTADYSVYYGVRISRTSPAFTADYDIGRFHFNTPSQHDAWSAFRTLPAIDAGQYTMQLYMRNDTASRTTFLGAEDTISVLWEEIP